MFSSSGMTPQVGFWLGIIKFDVNFSRVFDGANHVRDQPFLKLRYCIPHARNKTLTSKRYIYM